MCPHTLVVRVGLAAMLRPTYKPTFLNFLLDTSSIPSYTYTMSVRIKESIVYGWEQTKKQFWLVVGITVASIAIPTIIQNIGQGENGDPNSFFMLLSFLVGVLLTAGVTRMVLNIVESKPIQASLLWTEHKHYLPLLLGTVLNSLAVAIAFLALVIPGIIVGIRLSMFKYYIIEKNMSAIDSLKASWELTRGHTFDLFLFALARMGVVILGLIALFVGVLVAVPVVEIAKAKVYKELSAKKE